MFSQSLAFQYNTFPLPLAVSEPGIGGGQTPGQLDVFHLRRGKLPAVQIAVPVAPNGIAFDRSFTHLFVAVAGIGAVNEYNYPSATLLNAFVAPKGAYLSGVAVYPAATY